MRLITPLAMIAMLGAAHAAAPQFVSALDDVPLPPGVSEIADSVAAIEGLEGRIVSVQARGAIAPAELTRFYDQALPALGWTREGARFVRARQALTITFRRDDDDGALRITFRLIEQPASYAID